MSNYTANWVSNALTECQTELQNYHTKYTKQKVPKLSKKVYNAGNMETSTQCRDKPKLKAKGTCQFHHHCPTSFSEL